MVISRYILWTIKLCFVLRILIFVQKCLKNKKKLFYYFNITYFVFRTLTYRAMFYRDRAINNDWVCSSREMWLFWRFWKNNRVSIFHVTIRHQVYDNLRSYFQEVEVSDPSSFALKICLLRMSKTTKYIEIITCTMHYINLLIIIIQVD